MRKSSSIVARVLLSGSLLLLLFADSQAQRQSLKTKKAWHELLAYRNQDLHQLENQRERIEKLANRIIPERVEKDSFRRPRFIWNFTTPQNEARVVLFDFQEGISIPGQAVHKLYFFDQRGALLGATIVSNGWRQIPGEVRLIRRADLKLSLLEMSSVGVGLTPYGFTRQYYALLGDKAVLVRLEKKEAALMRNSYGCENPHFGSPVPKRTVDEWAEKLASTETVEVLRALMWLGGRHVDLKELEYEKSLPDDDWRMISCPEEAAADTKLYLAVRAREDVRQTLTRLAASSNEWIREAAEMALKPAETGYVFDEH